LLRENDEEEQEFEEIIRSTFPSKFAWKRKEWAEKSFLLGRIENNQAERKRLSISFNFLL
jgi:hypothetical protein